MLKEVRYGYKIMEKQKVLKKDDKGHNKTKKV